MGLEQQQAPLELIERVAISDEALGKTLAELGERANLAEVVVLSTCLRTEIYAVVERFHEGVEELRGYLEELAGSSPGDMDELVTVRFDDDVVTHVFEVASGLRSSLLGETEVLGQVRRALERAVEERVCGPVLGTLFKRAIQVGRLVRSSTGIARGTTSLAHAAVELADGRLEGSWSGRRVLVVGAGTMARGVVEALGGLDGVPELVVANRTRARAEALARRLDGRAVGLAELAGELDQADVAFVATGAPAPVLGPSLLAATSASHPRGEVGGLSPRQGGASQKVVVDLGVPRSVEPSLGRGDGVELLDMDALVAFTEAAQAARHQELGRAQAIVGREVERYHADTRARGAAPLVSALRSRVDDARRMEIERQRRKASLAGLGDEHWEQIDAITRTVLSKVLHEPSVVLKETAGTPRGERLSEALRALFGL